jgi:hypothetical protein
MDDGGIVPVEVGERIPDLREVGQDGGRGQARRPLPAEEALQVDALDPVHDDDVVVTLEEVVPHQRQARVRVEGEQCTGRPDELVPGASLGGRSNLQGHLAVVLMIQGPHHPAFATLADHLQGLVSATEHLCHAGHLEVAGGGDALTPSLTSSDRWSATAAPRHADHVGPNYGPPLW